MEFTTVFTKKKFSSTGEIATQNFFKHAIFTSGHSTFSLARQLKTTAAPLSPKSSPLFTIKAEAPSHSL